jgi:hypothetical protein
MTSFQGHRANWRFERLEHDSKDKHVQRMNAESRARERTEAMCEAIVWIFVLFLATAALLLFISGP